MKANELRVGNWIEHFEKEKINAYQIYNLQVKEDGGGVAEYYDLIKPIPLTEEILLKCGFIKDVYNKFTKDNLLIDLEDFTIYYFDDCFPNKFEYLHQLQNLYFALTSEELNIEL